jgi:hypothetical protein
MASFAQGLAASAPPSSAPPVPALNGYGDPVGTQYVLNTDGTVMLDPNGRPIKRSNPNAPAAEAQHISQLADAMFQPQDAAAMPFELWSRIAQRMGPNAAMSAIPLGSIPTPKARP